MHNWMREITGHRDGYGLTDEHLIQADDIDPGADGASHTYEIYDGAGGVPAIIDFQHGPRAVEGSTPGCLDVEILCILIDRYECFQAGPFACEENAAVLRHLRDAKAHMVMRANTRHVQHVLGKNEPHVS